MHVASKSKSPTKRHLKISATAQDLEPLKNHVLGHFKNRVKVPGFRAGKAPLSLVEKTVDQKTFLDEFLDHALNEFYRKALKQEKLRPVAQPQVELKSFVPYSSLEFEAEVETIGDIKLANYKTIKLAKKKTEITAKEVNDVLKSLQQRMAQRTEVTRAAKNGDEVIIDFEGTDEDKKPIGGADGKDYPLILGSKAFIPGFEEKLIGLKTGDEKEFDITFPANYGAKALQNKKVTFKVTVKKVQELKESKLDDALASKAGPFKTLVELKKDIKKQLGAEKQRSLDQQYENELIQKIVEKSTVEIPESLIDEQVQRLEEEEKQNLVYRGQTWQEHLKEEGVTEEEHRKRNRPDAELRVKAGLILSEVAEREKLTVEPDELKIQIDAHKSQYTDLSMQAELDKPENQQEIAAQLLTAKTINKLADYASK